MGEIVISVPADPSRRIILRDVAGRKDISIEEANANIYCVDDHDRVVWQINAPPPKVERDSFVTLFQAGHKLRADRFFGGEFVIDTRTGIASEVG